VISYEEYHPYGTSAYRAVVSGVEVSAKRYRYTGKERDEETGLYYHGARYLAPWLGRWVSADPAGLLDGAGVYSYVKGNPVRLSDPRGMAGEDPLRNDAPSGVIQFRNPATEGTFAHVADAPLKFEEPNTANASSEPTRPKAPAGPPAWLRNHMDVQTSPPDWLVADMAERVEDDALDAIAEAEPMTASEENGDGHSAIGQFLVGVAVGGLQGWLPFGFVGNAVNMPTKELQLGRGVGEAAMGIAQVIGGIGAIAGGGGSIAAGAGAAPTTGGASLLAVIAGKSAIAAGWVMVAQGATNLAAGAEAISHAMSMSGGSGSNGSSAPKLVHAGLKNAPEYPAGFTPGRSGTTRNTVNNKKLLEELRGIEPGEWYKVYKDGWVGNKRVSIHYFQSKSGKVFGMKVKNGWSND